MRNLSRIVWAEGMYLGPHHFQAQSRYFEDAIHFATEALWYCPYGFLGYELSMEALRNGTLLLTHARGVFEDGLAFEMPSCDPLPAPRQVADRFPPTSDSLLAYMAVPLRKQGGNCALDATAPVNGARFIAEEHAIADEITGGDEKAVRFGRKNIRFLLEGESKEGLQTLPLARVRRDGSHFVLDERFIPPVMKFSASEALMAMTRRLIDVLTQKNAAFTGAVTGYEKQQSGMSGQQIATFWFLHAVNGALATLRHLYLSKQGHPEELYSEMLRLGGALCTFGLNVSPASFPLYEHVDLQTCFERLDGHIREQLELFLPTNCYPVKLEQVDRYFWEADLNDQRFFGPSRWFVSIASEIGEAELINSTPEVVKVCSARFVPELVRRAMPGMALRHVSNPPAALMPRITKQYFAVNLAGPCWDHLRETRRIGVYVPGDIPNPELELLVLAEQ